MINQEFLTNKRKQLLIATASAGVVTAVLVAFITSGNSKKPVSDVDRILNGDRNKIILQNPDSAIKAEDKWLYNAEDKLSQHDKLLSESTSKDADLEHRLGELEKQYQETAKQQESEINFLKSELERKVQTQAQVQFQSNVGTVPSVPTVTIEDLAINLTEAPKESLTRKAGYFDSEGYIPAGAYAPAVIISGVDASVGLSSQSDPRQVLIRVKGNAVSSIYDGHVQKADLNGCLITGAAVGDISSEKAYIKLITLTCGNENNEVTEIKVKGYIAAHGKSGVRGTVVSREGDLVAKSFLAGLLGGFGQGLSDKVAPPLNFSNGLTTQGTLSTEDVARRGLGRGISSSSERLATYLINRAEQYQPVISIPSGLEVEVVFISGFFIDEGVKTGATPVEDGSMVMASNQSSMTGHD